MLFSFEFFHSQSRTHRNRWLTTLFPFIPPFLIQYLSTFLGFQSLSYMTKASGNIVECQVSQAGNLIYTASDYNPKSTCDADDDHML